MRRHPTGADVPRRNPSWALDQALLSIDADSEKSFALKAAIFHRAFREAVDGKVQTIDTSKRKPSTRANSRSQKKSDLKDSGPKNR